MLSTLASWTRALFRVRHRKGQTMRVPVMVPIGGRNVRIEYLEQVIDDDGVTPLSGATLGDPVYIQISKTANTSAESVKSTIYHEMVHVAFQLTGHHEILTEQQEEAIVVALESMLSPVLAFQTKAGIKYREVEFPWE